MYISPKRPIISLSGSAFDTEFSTEFQLRGDTDIGTLHAALQTAADCTNAQLSSDSYAATANVINRVPVGQWVTVSPPLFGAIQTAISVHRGSVACAANMGQNNALEVDGSRLRIRKLEPIQLDLQFLAPGFCIDRLAQTFTDFQVRNYVIRIGDLIRAAGTGPDGEGWHLDLDPRSGNRTERKKLITKNVSVATVANPGLAICREDQRPLPSDLRSVTVAHKYCCAAEAWGRTLMATDHNTAFRLAERNGLSVFLRQRSGGDLTETGTGVLRQPQIHENTEPLLKRA